MWLSKVSTGFESPADSREQPERVDIGRTSPGMRFTRIVAWKSPPGAGGLCLRAGRATGAAAALAAVLLTSLSLNAEESIDSSRCSGATRREYVMIGTDRIDVSDMNSVMKDDPLNLPEFNPYTFGLFFGSDVMWKYGFAGGGMNLLFSRGKNNAQYRARTFSTRLMTQFGVHVLKNERVLVSPVAGLGGGFSWIGIGPRSENFAEAVATSPVNRDLHKFSFLVDLGAEIDLLTLGGDASGKEKSGGGKCAGNRGKDLVGVRIGYMLDPIRNDAWYHGVTEIRNAPNLSLQGFYVRVVLGEMGLPVEVK